MNNSVAGGLISGAGSLLGSFVGLGGQALNYRLNKKMADYQFQKNVEMWNLQNEYNSPKNQMARLAEAGLNPNLVYGGGNVSGNQSGTPPHYEGVNAQFDLSNFSTAFTDALKTFNDLRLVDSTVSKNAEQEAVFRSQKTYYDNLASKALQDANESRSRQDLLDFQTSFGWATYPHKVASANYDAEIKKLIQKEKEYGYNIILPLESGRRKNEIDLLKARVSNTKASTSSLIIGTIKLNREIDLLEQQYENNKSLNKAQRWKLYSEIVNLRKIRDVWDSQIRLNEAKTNTEMFNAPNVTELPGLFIKAGVNAADGIYNDIVY